MRTRHRRVNRTCMPSISAFLRPSKRMIDANWEHFETKKAPRRRDRASITRTRRKMRAAHCPTPHPMRPSHPLARAHTWWKKYDLMRLTYRLSSFSSPLFALTTLIYYEDFFIFLTLRKDKSTNSFLNFFLSSYKFRVRPQNKRITVGRTKYRKIRYACDNKHALTL